MEARKGKVIRNGKDYDHYFPASQNQDLVILGKAEVKDTIGLIKKVVATTLIDTSKIAPLLRGKTLEETCKNVWNFVYEHIQYKKDEKGIEQVRRPARTWRDRRTGVDCDCMTTFISSVLTNLKIPHKYRITIYNFEVGFQHIYPVVPRDRKTDYDMNERTDYIVLDCVKDAFDCEQPFVEYKDYTMRLDYLNGLDDEENTPEFTSTIHHRDTETTDAKEMGELFDDEEMIGELGKTKVGKFLKKVGDTAGKGIRTINKVANPATILLRNGFLAAMKMNVGNVAKRLRFAYMKDDAARAKGINIASLNQVRKIRDKAETIFWQAGGNKDNFRSAILTGKGNKDKMVTLSGLDEIYGLGELGEPITATAIAAASGTVAAIAASLSQVKGLFVNKKAEEAAYTSEADIPVPASFSEESFMPAPAPVVSSAPKFLQRIIPKQVPPPGVQIRTAQSFAPPTQPMTNNFISPAPVQSSSTLPAATTEEKKGIFTDSLVWVKTNPGKSLLAAGIVVGGVLYLRTRKAAKSYPMKIKGLNGVPKRKSKKSLKRKGNIVKLSELKLK